MCIRSYDHAASIMHAAVGMQHSTCLRMSAVKPVAYPVQPVAYPVKLVAYLVVYNKDRSCSVGQSETSDKLVSGLVWHGTWVCYYTCSLAV